MFARIRRSLRQTGMTGKSMTEITLDKARTIIRKTLEKGREMELKPLSVVVLDAGGHVQAFEREDGASPGRYQIAHSKAYGAVMLGMPGSAQMARAEQQAYFMGALNGAFGGQVIPVPGGVLVRDKKGCGDRSCRCHWRHIRQ